MEMLESERRIVRSGLTSVSLLALLYAVFIFQPAMIWLTLAAGSGIGVSWITVIIFAEISRMMGRSITRQEAVVIYLLSGMGMSMAGAPFFIDKIWRAYYAQSDVVRMFNLHDKIPSWWVSLDIEAWLKRTFFSQSWITPMLIAIAILLMGEAVNLSMGLIMRQIFVQSMKLPFPIQEMQAVGIISVTERAGRQRDTLLIGAIGAMLYVLGLYGPTFIYEILGYPRGEPPIPWADFSAGIQRLLPGASFGIATDLLVLVNGFILPFNIVISIFIGSVIMYLIANPLLVRLNLTEFAREYFLGMNVAQIMYRSSLYAWAGPMIGVGLAAAIVPLYKRRRVLVDAFRSLWKVGVTGGKSLSLVVLLSIWIAASLSSVALTYLLVPLGATYLLIMLVMSLGWSFIWTLIDTYSIGITGLSLTPPGTVLPIIKYSYISVSGIPTYYDVWFIDPVVGTGGSGWTSSFKIVDRVDCDIMSFLKAFLIILPIVFITGFFYVQTFWSIAPMPSIMFRYTSIFWPIQAVNTSLWITGKMFQAFDPLWIVGAFVLTLAAGAIIEVIHLPISIIAIAAGLSTAIPTAVTILIGGIVGKIIRLRFGMEWWRDNNLILSAGVAIGTSVMLTALTVISMMARSLWVMPY